MLLIIKAYVSKIIKIILYVRKVVVHLQKFLEVMSTNIYVYTSLKTFNYITHFTGIALQPLFNN
jgi:hypothetical protein